MLTVVEKHQKCPIEISRAKNRLEIWYCTFLVYTILNFPRFFSAESGPSKRREIQNSVNKNVQYQNSNFCSNHLLQWFKVVYHCLNYFRVHWSANFKISLTLQSDSMISLLFHFLYFSELKADGRIAGVLTHPFGEWLNLLLQMIKPPST